MNSYKVRIAVATSTALLALTAAMPAVSGAATIAPNPGLSFPGDQESTFAKCVSVLIKNKPKVASIKATGNKYMDNRLKWLDTKNPEAVKKQLDSINHQIAKVKTADEKYLTKLQNPTAKTGGTAATASAPVKLNVEFFDFSNSINQIVGQAKTDLQAAKVNLNNASTASAAAATLCNAHWQIRVYPYVQLMTTWIPRNQNLTNRVAVNKAFYAQLVKLPLNNPAQLPNPAANDEQQNTIDKAIQSVTIAQINQMVNQNANYNSRKDFNNKYEASYKQLVKKLAADNNQMRGAKLKAKLKH